MPADVREQLDAILIAHEHTPIIFMGQTTPVSNFGHAFLVPDIDGRLLKNACLLAGKKRFVKVCSDWKLGASWRQMRHPTNVGHDSLRTEKNASMSNPVQTVPMRREEKSDWPITINQIL
jgi:hypothetical protein